MAKPRRVPAPRPLSGRKPASNNTRISINSSLGRIKNAASGGSIKSSLSKQASGSSRRDLSKTSEESKETVDQKRHEELVEGIASAYSENGTKEFEESTETSQNDETEKSNEKALTPIEQQREKFLEAMKDIGPERLERLQNMMNRFEIRMDGRGEARMAYGLDETQVDQEIEQDVVGTYKHLAELASAPNQDNQVFDQKTRQFLAENFMLHAADPTTMDQGGNNSCWLQAGTILGMVNSPDAMARYTSEAARTSSFKDANGHQHRFHRGIFGLGHEERNWSVAGANRSSARSPVSKMFDEGMSALVGRSTPDWGSFHGNWGSQNIMQKVTGKTFSDTGTLKNGSVRDTLLLDGGYLNYPISRHVTSVQLSKRDGQWYLIQDNQWGESQDYIKGRVNGDLSNFSVASMSNRYNHFNPAGPDQNLGPVGPAYVRNNNSFNSSGPGPGPFRNFFNDFQNIGPNPSPFGPIETDPVPDSLESKIQALASNGELNEDEETRLRSYLKELSDEGVSRELQEEHLPRLVAEIKSESAADENDEEKDKNKENQVAKDVEPTK